MCLADRTVPAPVLRATTAHADGQADQCRNLEEANYAGEANRCGDWPLAKQGDVEQVKQIDGEHRDEADRPRPGHGDHVTHDIASNEACLTLPWHIWHGYALRFRAVRPRATVGASGAMSVPIRALYPTAVPLADYRRFGRSTSRVTHGNFAASASFSATRTKVLRRNSSKFWSSSEA
jgi:hypothetical protein